MLPSLTTGSLAMVADTAIHWVWSNAEIKRCSCICPEAAASESSGGSKAWSGCPTFEICNIMRDSVLKRRPRLRMSGRSISAPNTPSGSLNWKEQPHKPYLAISFLQGVQAADQAFFQNLWFACHRWLCPCKKLLAYVDCYLPGSSGSWAGKAGKASSLQIEMLILRIADDVTSSKPAHLLQELQAMLQQLEKDKVWPRTDLFGIRRVAGKWNLQCACHLRPPSFKSRLGICALMAVLNSEYPSTLFESQEDMIRRVRERVVANLANPEVHCAVMCCASNSTLIISHLAAFCWGPSSGSSGSTVPSFELIKV